jgi:hypothetical protein
MRPQAAVVARPRARDLFVHVPSGRPRGGLDGG